MITKLKKPAIHWPSAWIKRARAAAVGLTAAVLIGMICSYLNPKTGVLLAILLLLVTPALLLARSDSRWLVPYIIAVWAFTPAIRRIYEWVYLEYNSVSLLSILPLLVTLTLILPMLGKPLEFSPLLKGFLLCMAVALGYGFLVGGLKNGVSGLFDLANYAVPLLIIPYEAVRRSNIEERKLWIVSFVNIAILAAAYGIVQFFVVPEWDAFWMNEVDMFSNGQPVPYEIRVFSTLNSPGPAAIFLSTALLAMLMNKSWRGFAGWLGVGIVTFGLILTLVRASWVTMVLALFLFILLEQGRKRWSLMGAILLAGIFMYSVLTVVPGGENLLNRFSTLGNLESDYSYNDRMQFVWKIIPMLADQPFGTGLGSVGVGTKLENDGRLGQFGNFDNGFLALFLTFGIVGGLAFARAVWLLVRLLRPIRQEMDPREAKYTLLAFSVLLAAIAYLIFENRLVGLGGFVVWLFAAIGLPKSTQSLNGKGMP